MHWSLIVTGDYNSIDDRMQPFWESLNGFNPNGKWDWYTEGDKGGDPGGLFLIKPQYRQLYNNCHRTDSAIVKHIDWTRMKRLKRQNGMTHAILHNGAWKSDVFWINSSKNSISPEDAKWKKSFWNTIASINENERVTWVDYHN
jgi:hypothetical protein